MKLYLLVGIMLVLASSLFATVVFYIPGPEKYLPLFFTSSGVFLVGIILSAAGIIQTALKH